jgi:hypothetical protein
MFFSHWTSPFSMPSRSGILRPPCFTAGENADLRALLAIVETIASCEVERPKFVAPGGRETAALRSR